MAIQPRCSIMRIVQDPECEARPSGIINGHLSESGDLDNIMVIKDLEVERSRRDSGQIIILTALSMTAMLAIAALSIDVSYMYDKRNRMAAAADAAAKSAAIELRRNSSIAQTSLEAFANYAVTQHGFNPATTTTVTVNHPPTSGPYSGSASFVEVIVGEPTATFFGTVLGWTSMTPRARAVAGAVSGSDCIIALGTPGATSPDGTKTIDIGNSTMTLNSCNLSDNGDIDGTNPNATTVTSSTSVSGSCYDTCDNFGGLTTGSLPVSDPLSSLPAPTVSDPDCTDSFTGTAITPGCYYKIQASGTLTFAPGVYKITGPFTAANNTVISGSGVLLYTSGTAAAGPCLSTSTAGCYAINNHATWTLSAPTSGTYTGILMYQDASDQLTANFDGNNPSYNLQGAMYFPSAEVTFRNGLGATNDCTLFIVKYLLINNGNGSFSNACSAFGGSPVLTVRIVE